jgi:hypothetical protein
VDRQEAFEVGRHGVQVGVREGTGWMATILRRPGEPYRPYYDRVPLEQVANSERFLPPSWIAKDRLDVTDDFIRYARPLIGDGFAPIETEGGVQRFARLRAQFVPKLAPAYRPVRLRQAAPVSPRS